MALLFYLVVLLGLLENNFFHTCLEVITYFSFIFFGILSFIPSKDDNNFVNKNNFINKLSNIGIGYIFIIAISIAVGELGDKTFLASIGLGISYPYSKFALIAGAICGMVISDSIAIIFGRFLKNKISEDSMKKLSGVLFITFGVISFIKFYLYSSII